MGVKLFQKRPENQSIKFILMEFFMYFICIRYRLNRKHNNSVLFDWFFTVIKIKEHVLILLVYPIERKVERSKISTYLIQNMYILLLKKEYIENNPFVNI